jgi:hydrogenase maturation factor
MCLGKLARVRAVRSDGSLDVESDGRSTVWSNLLLDHPPAIDDWVVGHAGFALAVLTADEARDALAARAGSTP